MPRSPATQSPLATAVALRAFKRMEVPLAEVAEPDEARDVSLLAAGEPHERTEA